MNHPTEGTFDQIGPTVLMECFDHEASLAPAVQEARRQYPHLRLRGHVTRRTLRASVVAARPVARAARAREHRPGAARRAASSSTTSSSDPPDEPEAALARRLDQLAGRLRAAGGVG